MTEFKQELRERLAQNLLEDIATTITELVKEIVPAEKPELAAMRNKMGCSQCGQNYHSEDIGFNICRSEMLKRMEE